MHSSAGAGHHVLVVLHDGHGHQRDLVLLVAVDQPEVDRRREVGAAAACPLGVAVAAVVELILIAPAQRGPARIAPAQRGPARPGLLALRPPGQLARRCSRGGLRPTSSSFEDGIEELELLRESRCRSLASSSACCSNVSINSASCVDNAVVCAP
ncbi:hypothetical protein H1V43_21370 [Streptomyces sp. PSKA54]|uniref:Uncharacterized protein n=1 Tax=Streptomyces himalayensis subsp. aureolus TaxID=2758039 RepID=A0A7W2D320_9ACTN|nr:hypothetical protein [Streptomyces himalayensis]MBA4863862.1 hypothetical protein [Streptomyces himalayensis subsp. aureolus]